MAQGPKDAEGGFFNRWSQRKQQATLDEAPAVTEDAESVEQASEIAPAAEPQLTDEDLAALPKIEDLTPDTDIRVFMRAGVPKSLRNAALRKMWLITPAIRDHVDPAVDYAWDWNTPGGVPGDGVAPGPEKAAKMLRDLFKPRQTPEAETPDDAAEQPAAAEEGEGAHGAAPQQADTAVQDAAEPSATSPVPNPVRRTGQGTEPVEKKDKTDPKQVAQPQPAPRRHGGALPQ